MESFVHGITRKMKIYLNGEFVEKEDAKVSVFDHGLLYGDGVFEGIRLWRWSASEFTKGGTVAPGR